jgi:hypothetical protein
MLRASRLNPLSEMKIIFGGTRCRVRPEIVDTERP